MSRADKNARAREPETVHLRIADRMRAGSSFSAACWREGEPPEAVRSKMRHNPRIAALIEGARAEAEDARRERLTRLVEDGKPTGGATWELERLHRAEFHLPTKIAMGGDAEAPPVASTVTITLADAIEAARQKDDE
jgi:hypothetical protein